MPATLAQITEALGGELLGAAELQILGIASLVSAGSAHISFVTGPKHLEAMRESQAGALIVPPALASEAGRQASLIVVEQPYLYYARLSQWWLARERAALAASHHPSAVVAADARLGQGVHLGAFAVVESGAVLGDGVWVGAHTVIEAGARVGAASRLAPGVQVGARCELGQRCIVHSGVVIGADGFGFAPQDGHWVKIEQLGRVRIGDDVEIGANCTIDRGALDDTVIEDGVKLDNLIHIAHNVHIGRNTAIAGCAAVAGSARIGAHCTIGGDAKILGHLELVDGVHISACSVVTRSIKTPGQYTGFFPIDDNAAWEKNAASLRSLHKLRDRVRQLEKKNSP